MSKITPDPGVVSTDSTTTPQPSSVQSTMDAVRIPEPQQPSTSVFDMAKLRLPQDFAGTGDEVVQAAVLVGRPNPQTFFRAHPTDYLLAATLTYEQSLYLVSREMVKPLEGDVQVKLIVPYIDRDGDIGLWPLSQLQTTGQTNSWTASAHRILIASRSGWVRFRSNRKLGSYELVKPHTMWDEPKWPERDFEDLLKLGFDGKIIESFDHPAVRALRGEE